MKRLTRCLIAALAVCTLSARADAQQLWNWNFGSNSGTFVTSLGGGAGTYTLFDFFVTASGSGLGIGSMSGGQYSADGFSTTTPYTFDWNGSAVTQWDHAGTNTFEWWVFTDVTQSNSFVVFGWETCNVNSANQAAVYNGQSNTCNVPSFDVTVAPAVAPVPEPASMALLATGLAAIVGAKRRRRSLNVG